MSVGKLTYRVLARRAGVVGAALCVSLATFVAAAAPASAETSPVDTALPETSITRVDKSRYPDVRLQFSIAERDGKLPKITIYENDKKVRNVSVFNGPIGFYEDRPRNVLMIVLDASNTMRGAKFEQAKAAAIQLIDQSRKGDRIGLVSYGQGAEVVMEPTTDTEAVKAALDQIEITFGTRTFEAVRIASKELGKEEANRRMLVLLADGEVLKDETTYEEAIEAAKAAKVEIHSVGIKGKVFMPGELEKFANTTNGSFQAVEDENDLQAVYAELGRALLRSYWLEYRSSQPAGQAVKVVLSAEGYDDSIQSYTTPHLRGRNGTIKVTPPPIVKHEEPAVKLPGGQAGRMIAAAPFGLILAFVMWLILEKKSRPNLRARVEPYTKRNLLVPQKGDSKKSKMALLAPLFKITDTVLGRSSLFRKFRRLLEQANLPLREVELLYMIFGGLLVGALLGFILFQGILGSAMIGTMGLFTPYIWVRFKARKRKKAFEEQLADVLQTVAASLKAGHSFNQSITAIIKEAPNPTSEEFQRVMTETRLGMPLEEALQAMSDRMGSIDFEFAVTTVNIQRTVGGSLSEILEMVGDTVRNRQQFRKKVKALTSMGRMSAYVLLGMPIFMGGLISLLRRDYMAPLLFTQTGHILMGVGGFFMLLGYVACMKIVNIKT